MERAIVAVGYAIGAGLVLAHRRGRIPKIAAWTWDAPHPSGSRERGATVTWRGRGFYGGVFGAPQRARP